MKIFLYSTLFFASVFLPPEISLKVAMVVIFILVGLTVITHNGKKNSIFGIVTGKDELFLNEGKMMIINHFVISILMFMIMSSLALGGFGLFPAYSSTPTGHEINLLFFIPYCVYVIPKIKDSYQYLRDARKQSIQ